MSALSPKLPFDFTASMQRLCEDITHKVPTFQHVDMEKVLVTFAQTRRRVSHGFQAKLTPLRFQGGESTTWRNGEEYAVQRVFRGSTEILYLLTFYLPRFLDQPFHEKLTTVFHELYHISPGFDGDIRRFPGRCSVHTQSQANFDREMFQLGQTYLAKKPSKRIWGFLEKDFSELRRHHGTVIGLTTPIPRLLKLKRPRAA